MNKKSLVILLSVTILFAAAQAFASGMSTYGYNRGDIPEIGVEGESIATCTVEEPKDLELSRQDVPEMGWHRYAYSGADLASTCAGAGETAPSDNVQRLDIPEVWYHM